MRLPHRTPLLAAIVLLSAPFARAQTAADPAGHWEGRIDVPNQEMGMTVDLARNATGVWIGSMSIPNSTTIDVPLGNISVEGTAVRFTAGLPRPTSFEGALSPDASGLSGTVSDVRGSVSFELKRNGPANVKVPPPSSALAKEFEGAWEGTLEAGGKIKRVGLKLSAAADGAATGTLIDLDEGSLEIPVTTVTIKDKQLQLESRAVSGTYTGSLGTGGEIAGEWTQGPTHISLTFKRAPSAK